MKLKACFFRRMALTTAALFAALLLSSCGTARRVDRRWDRRDMRYDRRVNRAERWGGYYDHFY
jgi:hypothetical protein